MALQKIDGTKLKTEFIPTSDLGTIDYNASYITADNVVFVNCRFTAIQDISAYGAVLNNLPQPKESIYTIATQSGSNGTIWNFSKYSNNKRLSNWKAIPSGTILLFNFSYVGGGN